MLFTAMKLVNGELPLPRRCVAPAFSLRRRHQIWLGAAVSSRGSCSFTSSTSRRLHLSYQTTRSAQPTCPCTLPPPPMLVCLLLPVRRPTRLEYGFRCSRSTSRRQGSRPGLAAWPSWLRRPPLRLAGTSGVRRTCALGSDGVLSTGGRGSGVGPFAIYHYNVCNLVFVSSI